MHNALYDSNNWSQWSTSSDPTPYYKQYAQAIGLNMTQFNNDFSSDTVNNRITADVAAFKKTGQQMATPSFFLDGTYIPNTDLIDANGPSLAAFSKVIDNEITKKVAQH